ncbi:MAG: hypothetical protein HYX96_02310 [Chloroflexi bacterium]|nr:hypothetical protein [Chloroflexota bacterium]
MPYDWGPHFIVPSDLLRNFSGVVLLREELEEELLEKELECLGLSGPVIRITNPWYFRRKGEESWIKAGESDDIRNNFPVRWDTRPLQDGRYEILGIMHVIIKTAGEEKVIARQNIVEVNVEN